MELARFNSSGLDTSIEPDSPSSEYEGRSFDDIYDERVKETQSSGAITIQPQPISITIQNPPQRLESQTSQEVFFADVYKSNIQKHFETTTFVEQHGKQKKLIERNLENIYIARKTELFNFGDEIGTKGFIEEDWDPGKLFTAEDSSVGTVRRFIFAQSGFGKTYFCEFAMYQWSKTECNAKSRIIYESSATMYHL